MKPIVPGLMVTDVTRAFGAKLDPPFAL